MKFEDSIVVRVRVTTLASSTWTSRPSSDSCSDHLITFKQPQMNLPTPPNHLGGHWKLFSEHVFSPPHVHTLYGTRSTFTLQHHQIPSSCHSITHQTSFPHHSPHQLTIYNHPSPIRTLKCREGTPILILKYHPTTTSTTPPSIYNHS